MKILLIDLDSKIPNLALMKVSAYEKMQGNEVGFDIQNPDKIYCSVVFSKNSGQASGLRSMFPGIPIDYGGPGWREDNSLPAYIECIKPDYDLYPSHFSQGFTTRGCIRKCGFCIVPRIEGNLQIWHHPSSFHDDRFRECMIMDNNLLAAPSKWIKNVLGWFRDCGVGMNATSGFDARLLTEEWAGLIHDVKHPKGIRLAWDHTSNEPEIINAVNLLKNAGFDLKHDISFYVLAGFDSGFEDALYRCNRLRELGTNAFVMRYHKKDANINKLSKWANRRWAYWSAPFSLSNFRGAA